MQWFYIATLTPVALLTLGGIFGGLWVWAALIYVTCLVFVLDRLMSGKVVEPDADGNIPTGYFLSEVLGLLHLALLPLAVASVAGMAGPQEGTRIVAFFAFGLFFGQVSNPNAHELIHRAARWPRRLGVLVYISMLYGHHASAHPLIHHVHVATDKDPNSPALGEGFYRFALRAWIGSFREGLRAENARRARASTPRSPLSHPYVYYLGGAALFLIGVHALFGPVGLLAYVGLAIYAQMQHLQSDYVQHYGLRRAIGPDGKPEPIGPQHSWNSPAFHSNAMMLNVALHSDHHLHPSRSYPRLELDPATMPIMPASLPVMAGLSLVPSIYRRRMAPHLPEAARGNGDPAPNPAS